MSVKHNHPLVWINWSCCRVFPKICLIVVLSLLMVFVAAPVSADSVFKDQNREKVEELRDDLREMVTSARDRVFPSLVNIQVTTSRYFGGEEHKGQATGSGTIISPEGYVLTNFHVARNGQKFVCTLSDKQEINVWPLQHLETPMKWSLATPSCQWVAPGPCPDQ